jgi:hypothetical protein
MKRLTLLFILILTTTVYGLAIGFSDVNESDWFYTQVDALTSSGIISGYGDGTFRPESDISVEEFVTLLVKVTGNTEADVIKSRWSDGFIERAKILNWIQEGELLDVTVQITRGEMSRLLLRASTLPVPDNYMEFHSSISDISTMDTYWQNIVLRTYAAGLISGYPDGSFRKDGLLNRAEASAVLYKLYDPEVIIYPELPSQLESRIDQIKSKWATLKPSHSGDIFNANPTVTAPFSAGSLQTSYLEDGINMLNFIRFLSGLNDNTYYTDEANSIAQHGAVMLTVTEFSHTPTQPEGMSDSFYDIAYDGTSSGNLAGGIKPLSSAVKGLVDDEDEFNIDRLGHRRWFLLPTLYEVGLGYAETEENYRYYSVVKVFRELELQTAEYTSVLYPSAQAFPIEFMIEELPWSVSLNPSEYDNTRIDEIKVTYENLSQGTSMTFDETNKDKLGKYFNVETNYYGIPFCIIFRPDFNEMTLYHVNDRIKITIDNLYTLSGDKESMVYETLLFTLGN